VCWWAPGRPGTHQQLARSGRVCRHVFARHPGIINRAVTGKVATVLHAAANELGNGRSLPPEAHRAIRCLADALRHDMQPPPDDLHATP
jgi:hypothetical protein